MLVSCLPEAELAAVSSSLSSDAEWASARGRLFLVDLAGSERTKRSGVVGQTFDEACSINQSLTTLGRCSEVLASNKKEKPPFRESKLTRLLSNAIGGAAKTTLIVCVAPTMTDQFETVNSLDFGQQAMNVVVRAKVNASTDFGSLTASLLAQRVDPRRRVEPSRSKRRPEMTEIHPITGRPVADRRIRGQAGLRWLARTTDAISDGKLR